MIFGALEHAANGWLRGFGTSDNVGPPDSMVYKGAEYALEDLDKNVKIMRHNSVMV